MVISEMKVIFFQNEVIKLFDFFPELKTESRLVLSENDSRRKTFWEIFSILPEMENELVSVQKDGEGTFKFSIENSNVILFRDTMPTKAELDQCMKI